MIFDHLILPQGAGQKHCAVACPIHVSNSLTKSGWIPSNGLGGDSITDGRTDGQTDGGDYNIPFAFLKKRGDNNVNQKNYSKTCVKQPLSRRPKIGFQDQLLLNAGQKYCRMQETFNLH